MATPKQWTPNFQVNTDAAAIGTQNQPQIIALSNGNILVAWDELSPGVGASNGTDIVGKIFDSRGKVVRDSFQINAARAVDNEGDFDIAATNDGGFVMVYVDADISAPNHTTVVFERFDSSGSAVSNGVIADENVAADDLSNPQIALNFIDNSFTVSFTDLVAGDTNVRAVGVTFQNAAGTAYTTGTEFDAAQNTGDIDDIGDLVILSNGNYAGANREFDGATPGVDIHIFDPNGTPLRSIQNFAPGINTTPRLASLTNGTFVVVWNQTDSNNGDLFARIYDNAGNLVLGTFTVAGSPNAENEPDVAALPDGGFIVFWDDETLGLQAQEFKADGSTDGNTFTVSVNAPSDSDVHVTADGRILFAWQESGEMFAAIYDPRGKVIKVADFPKGLPNFLETNDAVAREQGGTIIGTNAANELIGVGGDDILKGKGAADKLVGGAGNDKLLGGDGKDTLVGGGDQDVLNGGQGADKMKGGKHDDTYFVDHANDKVIEKSGEGRDLVKASLDYTLTAQVEDLRLLGSDPLNGTGNDKGNEIVGNSGDNKLKGEAGKDRLEGGKGDDILIGGSASDVFVFRPNGGNNLVKDFQDGKDTIDLADFGFVSKAEALSHFVEWGTANDDQVRFDHNGTIIRIKGADLGDMSGQDILV